MQENVDTYKYNRIIYLQHIILINVLLLECYATRVKIPPEDIAGKSDEALSDDIIAFEAL